MEDFPHKKKYEPLGEYLAALPRGTNEVTRSFVQVEQIIGDKLPPSAFRHREWWSNQQGGSRAPHWRSAGYEVDYADLSQEIVCFRRVAHPTRERPRAMRLPEVVTTVNERALGRPIGGLQEWRKARKRLDRLPSRKLFNASTLHESYVFHVGGRSELQYNIGFETVGEVRKFRHGVAFSLEPSQSLPDVTVLLPKIARFNKYVRVYPNAFDGFQMWHSLKDGQRSETHSVTTIADAVAQRDFFIFIGRLQPIDAICVDAILDDFDRLLPVYEYVEGEDSFPARAPESERDGFAGSLSKQQRAVKASYERRAKAVEVELRHNEIGDALALYLETIHGEGSTAKELPTGNGTNIDVAVRVNGKSIYYEVKTGASAQACIREALGQLLEYSCWPGATRADRLVVVGEAPFDKKAKTYIECLNKDFSLRIEYRQFDMKSRRLV